MNDFSMDMTPTDAGTAYLAAVVGSNGSILDETRLRADDFTEPAQGRIFEAAMKLHAAGKPVDAVTLAEELPSVYNTQVTGLLAYSHLSYGHDAYAEIIERHGVRRRVVEAGTMIASLDPDLDPADMLDRAEAIMQQVVDRSVKPAYRFVGEMLDEVLVNVSEDPTYVPSPWRGLNTLIGGFRPGDVYVVAARPAVGKSIIAAQIATALSAHGAVAFSSLEMTAPELVQRFISERAQVNASHLKHSRLTDYDYEKINSRRDALIQLNIAIDDRTSISPADVRAFARGLSKKHHLAGVVVDYLQLMESSDTRDRHVQVAEFSRRMKVLAKDFNIPVVVLSQLNRESERRMNGRPRMADLRESGAIEQDASVIILLSREGEEPNERIILDVVKNRHGSTAEVELDWQGCYSRAVDLD